MVAFPLAAGFAQIIAPFSDATPIMKYAYVSIYLKRWWPPIWV